MVEFVRNPVGGVFFVVVIFWMSSLLGSIFIMGPFLPLLFIYTPLYRKLNDYLLACWICFPLAFLEKVYGIKIVVSGDAFKHGDKSVIIMNHRTRLDWLFFWSCLIRRSQLHYEKIMLKNELKHAPGGGWAMQVAAFIFVHRRWELDKAILSDVVDYFSALRHPTQILMFPEGTDLSERNRERNAVYAKKNGLPVYDYVLHPRTTGFTFLVESLRKNNMLDAVHDVSVAYPQNLPQREIDILKGDFPREIHFHIKRHPIATLPIDEEGLQKWCNEQWSEKEEVLKEFYKNKRFVNVENVETGHIITDCLHRWEGGVLRGDSWWHI
ncbi:lysocardiolipin acyltransferase 1-like [Saccoglossus kowalevskii]